MTGVKKERILQIVKDLVGERRRPVTATEVWRKLRLMGYDVTERWVRSVLSRLEAEGKLVRIGRKPAKFFPVEAHRQLPLDRFLKVEESITLEEVTEREEATALLSEEDARKVAEFSRSIAREVAWDLGEGVQLKKGVVQVFSRFADENPVELYLKMLIWLKNKFDELCNSYGKIDNLAVKRKIKEKIRVLENLLKTLYGGMLGIPIYSGKTPAKIQVPHIHFKASFGVSGGDFIFEFEENEIRRYLERRVVRDRVVEEVEPYRPGKPYFVGIDSSYRRILLSEGLGELVPAAPVPPLFIITAVRFHAWAYADSGGSDYVVEPEPEEFPQLDSLKAFHEGYTIPYRMMELIEENMRKRAVEAQMNVLEYNQALKTLRPSQASYITASGYRKLPPRTPDVIFIDGRIMPYEHKVDDFAYGGVHGEIVRNSFMRFNELLDEIKLKFPGTILVGVVKRALTVYVLPLLLWYALVNNAIKEEAFWRYALAYHLERILITEMLKVVKRERGWEAVRTFGVVRRMWPLDGHLVTAFLNGARSIDDEYRVEFWDSEAPISGYAGVRGLLSERGLDENYSVHYSRSLASTSVVTFYYLPPNIKADSSAELYVLPRLEVLLPADERQTPRHVLETAKEAMRRACLPEIPEAYLLYDLAFPFDVSLRDIPLILPRPIKAADEHARLQDEKLTGEYANYLLLAVLRILREEYGIT